MDSKECGERERTPVEDDELDELLDDLEELEETADSPTERHVLTRTVAVLDRLSRGRIFGLDDLAQQIVGGFILSAPFVVTEEVWSLADSMSTLQWAITVLLVLSIGYGTLYQADDDRDPDEEASIFGIPLRYLSLIAISYLSVTILALVFNAPVTFDKGVPTTAKAISIGAIFSVVGAATADSLF